MTGKAYVMLGDGGHAASLWSALGDLPLARVALVTPHPPLSRPELERVTEDFVTSLPNHATTIINGLGQMSPLSPRAAIFDAFTNQGYSFAQVTHPHSFVDPLAQLGDAAQVLAGVVVGPGSVVGANTILNTGSVIEHGCSLGKHVHITSGATICGDVTIGDHCVIGPGATVVRGVTIGARSVIAAGAVVIDNVSPDSLMMGVPARRQSV